MPTPTGVVTAIETLEAMGIVCPSDAKAMARGWLAILADLSDDDLQGAVVSYLRSPESRYGWPKPGQLLEHVPRRRIEQQQATLSGQEAWARVMAELGRFNVYNPHRPSWPCHPERFDRIVRGLGGLGHLANTPDADLHWTGKRFAEMWDSMADRDEVVHRAENVILLADRMADRKLLEGE